MRHGDISLKKSQRFCPKILRFCPQCNDETRFLSPRVRLRDSVLAPDPGIVMSKELQATEMGPTELKTLSTAEIKRSHSYVDDRPWSISLGKVLFSRSISQLVSSTSFESRID